jgi:hypothetical protein
MAAIYCGVDASAIHSYVTLLSSIISAITIGAPNMEAADRPISAKSEKTASVEASEAINLRTAKHALRAI